MTSFHFKNPREHPQFAKNLRKKAPKSEQFVWNALREMKSESGLKFRRQHPLHPYIVDFACIEARLIVELDGMSHDNRLGYDRARDNHLQKKGCTVIRFTNEEVLGNLEGVVLTIVRSAQKLSAQIKRKLPSPTPPASGRGIPPRLPQNSSTK